jgi:hypothetical protein
MNEQDYYNLGLQGLLDPAGRIVATLTSPVVVSGDPGVSWAIEMHLAKIIGQPRTIPVYTTVIRAGTNSQFAIVGWVNVVVVETGHDRGVKIIRVQPIAPFKVFDSPDRNGLGNSIALTR